MGLMTRNAWVVASLFLAMASVSKVQAALVYGLTDENDLLSFDSATPGDLISASDISGLAVNEDLIGIDFRPANGLLYGVGDQGNIYTISTSTGVATYVSTINVSLSGSRFGVDFNPIPDRLRIVSDLDQNLRVNVATGATNVDGTLKYLASAINNAAGATGDNPNVTAAAYTESYAPSPRAGATVLYDIDVRGTEDRLVIQSPPNNGELTVVGSLGFNASSLNGFDIYFESGVNKAIAALQLTPNGTTELYSVNLVTGLATSIGTIGGGDILDGIAVAPIPEPATASLLVLGAAGILMRRRGR